MEGLATIDRDMMRGLDRHFGEQREDRQASEMPQPADPSFSRIDILGTLRAVQLTASTMNSMTDHIRQLEARCEAAEASIGESEMRNTELTSQLDEMAGRRDELSATLEAERECAAKLEMLTAEHVAQAARLERNLGLVRADLASVVEAVDNQLGSRGGVFRVFHGR